MAERLKTLILLQLNFSKFKKSLKGKKAFVGIMLRILLVAVITVAMFFVLKIFNNILYISVRPAFLLFVVGISQIFSIIANANTLVDELYLSKDNTMLFAMPARHSEIFVSKLIVFYIKEFVKNLYFIVPLLISFGFYTQIGILYFLNLILLTIVLPLFAVLIGALLSMPIMVVKRIFKAVPFLQTVIYVVIFGLIFYGVVYVVNQVPSPLRILAQYNGFINLVNNFMETFNSYLFFYINAVYTLFSFRAFYDYLYVFGALFILFFAVFVLSMPLYFRIASHFSERSVNVKHRVNNDKSHKTFNSFFIKETKTLFRTPGKLISYLSFPLSFPFMIYILNKIFMAINTNLLGNILVIGLNIMISLILITASNCVSATAISSEGEEFAVLKTAPIQAYKIAYAKILMNFIFSTLGIVSGMVVLKLISTIDVYQIILLGITLIMVNAGHLLWSFQIDILNPQLRDFATKGHNNNNKNISFSLVIGLVISIVFGAVALFFFLDSIAGGWVRIVGIALAFLIVRIVLFIANLKVYFKRIEF